MKGVTRFVRKHFVDLAERTLRQAEDFQHTQEKQLSFLLKNGRETFWGHKFKMSRIGGYDDFRKELPIVEYPDIRPEIMKMIQGEKNILWPGKVFRYAQSSGTSDGKSKYIPITDLSLRLNHYRGGKECVGHYLRQNKKSRLFDGKAFILGGSFSTELNIPDSNVKIGDLSANLIDAINPIVNLLRIPAKNIALISDWSEKLPRLVSSSLNENITNISGVPSWFLTVLQSVIKAKGVRTIHDVWPNLEVFFHGGIAFGPYREQYKLITDESKMNYLETYNASEGFFAVQTDNSDCSMMLLPDAGVFYEFIPADSNESDIIPSWEIRKGSVYALVITACNGLWRYRIGDLVKIEDVCPLKITIVGRTKHYINAFGEEVMVYNTDRAIEKACNEAGCTIKNYSIAPIFASGGQKGKHQWVIEFDNSPGEIESFAVLLDKKLQDENSDYQAKRQGNIFLDCLSIVVARNGLFDDWLALSGKLGGQRKIPRLSNDRRIIDELLKMN